MPIGIRFPFKSSTQGGVFESTRASQDSVKSNLVCLLTTKRGQRPMRQNLYSPLFDFIMEPLDDFTMQELKRQLEEKIREFIPEIKIKAIELTESPAEHLLKVNLKYSLNFLGNAIDQVAITLNTEG